MSVIQNNYTLTSMLLSGAYELLHCSSESSTYAFDPPTSIPHECWGRDGCQHGFTAPCWREQKCQELKVCGLNPFDRAFHASTTSISGPAPIESMLLLAARGGGRMEKAKNITKLRLSKQMECSKAVEKDDCVVLPHNDISQGAEKMAISWVNETDDGEELETDFVYVNKAIESRDTRISWFSCRNQKPKSKKSSKKLLATWINSRIQSAYPSGARYNPGGNLQILNAASKCSDTMNVCLRQLQQINVPRIQFECNYLCPCRNTKRSVPAYAGRRDIVECGNRKISSGIRHKLQVFRTEYKGWGVRSLETIKKGEMVCGYAGLYQLEKNVQEWAHQDEFTNSYVMNLSQNAKKTSAVVNGNELRSVSGFINHECSNANLDLFHWYGDHLDTCFPCVGFRAKDNISPLTELCFNYGVKIFAECPLCGVEHCLCDHCMDWKHDISHTKKNGLR